jgi:hypothetical protein
MSLATSSIFGRSRQTPDCVCQSARWLHDPAVFADRVTGLKEQAQINPARYVLMEEGGHLTAQIEEKYAEKPCFMRSAHCCTKTERCPAHGGAFFTVPARIMGRAKRFAS